MNTAIAIPNRQLVAVSPHELIPAQAQLIDWCQMKIHALGAELREQRQNLRQAKTMKWKHSGWTNAVARTKKRMVYYTKLKLAARAGYLVVPNFDVEVIAVRVKPGTRPVDEADVRGATPQLLPPRTGQYVDDETFGEDRPRHYTDRDGKPQTVYDFHPTAFDPDLDFPAALVKPSIMAATDRAMALRLFDRIGIVRKGKRSDPIVVGQIIDPKCTRSWELRTNPKCVTFFIAWWLDTRDL